MGLVFGTENLIKMYVIIAMSSKVFKVPFPFTRIIMRISVNMKLRS